MKIKIEHFTLTPEDLEEFMNQGRESMLYQLLKDKVITKKQYQDYRLNYAMIYKRPSFFSGVWNKLFPKEEADCRRAMLVKQCNWKIEQLEEESDDS